MMFPEKAAVSAGMQAADPPKAVVFLEPSWDRVLRDDSVTLKCQGDYSPGNTSTEWFHNGSLISSQNSSYFIAAARVEDSGEYRCQTSLSMLSDPVQLEVHNGWLVLQAPRWVFQQGEPIHLRCHSWKNTLVHSVTYLQNGKGRRFFHQNSDYHIPTATPDHSGSYFCRGLVGKKNVSSETMNIIVQGSTSPSVSPSFPPWHQIAFCLVMVLLFAVDTGLYFSLQRNLRSSPRDWKDHKFKWSKDPQDK
ncbi:low affinity immunoglobulin gamma Fc region receptor III-A isoform X3 [Lemur catta]|uniref:low affinity immunoglobulin gamma Fc region receptor III-A isoform X3 n=1 Tax=Lemur catta TaxID=9447 RepID=UPI001E2678F1|nr:low affinity immunoglobulin gamma Fc region receptor III-A isoform X3 [Lemur catta]XP_045403143.1 low affinity immunoglobulin gamma Fc region receptor III-A isoform X3 [Lemur catta]